MSYFGYASLMAENCEWEFIYYYADTSDLEGRPSDCEWLVPGTYVE